MSEDPKESYEQQKAREIRETIETDKIDFNKIAKRLSDSLSLIVEKGTALQKQALKNAIAKVAKEQGIPEKDILQIISESANAPLDRVLCDYLVRTARESEAKSKYFGSKQENCNMYASEFITRVLQKLTGTKGGFYYDKDNKPTNYIAYAPIHEGATKALRGKSVKKLTREDFAALPPGLVFFVNTPAVYKDENKILPGSAEKLPTSNKLGDNQERHWFTFAGLDEQGEPICIDNFGHNNSLSFVKGHFGGSRVVINVFDPLKPFRQTLVSLNGKLEVQEAVQASANSVSN